MSWALKGLAAPLKNKVFNLKPQMTLGRKGDIVVPDTKSSGIHARIVVHEGKMYLTDNDSKNGTRINGERITKPVKLKAGLKFYIGDQGFEVVEIKEIEDDLTPPPPAAEKAKEKARPKIDDATPPPAPIRQPKPPRALDPEVTPPPATAKPPDEVELPLEVEPALEATVARPSPQPVQLEPIPAPAAPAKKRRYWHEILADFVEQKQENFSDRVRPVTPLSPALVLDFVRGLQANTKWIIGYGPRKVGASALDLPIHEPGAPPVCFEISSSGEGITFKTAHPNAVTVNGEALDSHVLRVGDKIRINETIIEVDFEE